jgi:Mn2+/Fe2+ NRAMP family transporter
MYIGILLFVAIVVLLLVLNRIRIRRAISRTEKKLKALGLIYCASVVIFAITELIIRHKGPDSKVLI